MINRRSAYACMRVYALMCEGEGVRMCACVIARVIHTLWCTTAVASLSIRRHICVKGMVRLSTARK